MSTESSVLSTKSPVGSMEILKPVHLYGLLLCIAERGVERVEFTVTVNKLELCICDGV